MSKDVVARCGKFVETVYDECLTPDARVEFISEIFYDWTALAPGIRASRKFVIDFDVLCQINEDSDINVPAKLPFPEVTVIITGTTGNDCVIFAKETVETGEKIEVMENTVIKPGDRYLDVRVGMFTQEIRYANGILPLDLHVSEKQELHPTNREKACPYDQFMVYQPYTFPDHYDAEKIHQAVEFGFVALCDFIRAVNTKLFFEERVPGRRPPTPQAAAKSVKNAKYEHTLMTLSPDHYVFDSEGALAGRKHRAHDVRGHWRKHKHRLRSGPYKGLYHSWVTAHPRGDAELGVVTHDYEVTS